MKDKQKNFKVLQRVFDNHTFRIPSIYWLATAIDGDSIPSELMGHAEDWLEAVGVDPDLDDECEIAEQLFDNQKHGFIASVEIPVPQSGRRDAYATWGWGCVWVRWVYSETVDGLIDEAERVGREMLDKHFSGDQS